MKRLTFRWAFALMLLIASGLAPQVRAASITNNFDVVYDYVLNGIIGETNWDGIYLGFGDIPGGAVGGSGAGATLQGNTLLQAGPSLGYLTVQTTGSDWSANGDDGFYAWKLVSGDFDVSVQNAGPWQSIGNNFAGLMVRAWNTNQSGGRVSFTATNNATSENWLALFRAQQFGLGEIRQATNGANIENTFPEVAADTNTSRFYRITRVGNTFSFYLKTNQTDAWYLITNASAGGGYTAASGSVTRPDWSGQPVQVGIAQAVFGRPGTPPKDFFTDFELSGPNVSLAAAPPAAPDTVVASAPNPNGSVNLSWHTNGGNGSIVIVRKINPGGILVVNPVQGLNYTNDLNFQATNTLMAGNTHVVYAGPLTNITVSGLAGSNNLYTAEVLSYSSAGSIVYNTASPATGNFLGGGVPASIVVSVFPTNLPVGGVGQVKVVATFTTGDQVDVTTDPSTLVSSSDPSTISVNSGVLNGIQTGSATISVTYAGFSGSTNISVVPPRFTDSFTNAQDYLAVGLPGSSWDGLYARPGDVPNGNNGGDPMSVAIADAGITTNGALTVSASGTTFEAAADDGFYLFKTMPGDFQACVHVDLSSHGAFQFAGLVARASNPTNAGAPYIGGEHNMAWWFFDQFATPVSLRATINGAAVEQNLSGTVPLNTMWLLLERLNGTNFLAFYKVNAADPWILGATSVDASMTNGVPMQIGLAQSTFTASPLETVRFDSFWLDGTGLIAAPPVPVPPPSTNLVMTLNPDVSMTLRWINPIAVDGTAPAVARSVVIMRAAAPVSAQPNLGFAFAGNSVFGDPANSLGSGNYVVYRTVSGDTNQNQQVTVTGLSPGVVYYAAVYNFSGLGTTRTFNTAITTFGNLQDGVLLGLSTQVVPATGIPLGGVGIPLVNGIFTGGGLANITPAVTITSGNTNIVLATNGALTGLALGTATIQVTYGGFTNVANVTVRNPSFTDNFGTSRDYLASGASGSSWDGVYVSTNVPDKVYVSDPATATLAIDANMTSNNVLSIANLNSGYEFNQDDGTFLFKYVPGDFQAAVNLLVYTNNGSQNYLCAGLMARGFTTATNGMLGAPMDLAGNECWVAWERFDEFGIGTRYEATIDNATQRPTNPDVNGADRYMLLARVNSTNFYFFQRANTNVAWHSTGIGHLTGSTALAKFAGQPMQVGIMVSGFNSGTPVNAGFANYLLDISTPGISIVPSGTNVVVTWSGSATSQLQSTTSLNPPSWQPVPVTPVLTNGQYTVTLPAVSGNLFFRVQF